MTPHPSAPTLDSERPSRLRWVMIGMAFLATVINYLDRQTLSVVAPKLREEFGMSNEAYGTVISAFMLAYTISNGVSGPLVDRLGTRLGYALCMFIWSTAGILTSLATGARSLAGFRFLLGIGEAGNWPAGVKVATEWFPARERAFACGIFNSGAAIGAIIAAPLVAWLTIRFGWKTTFVVIGLIGYVWLIAWWLIYRTPPAVAAETAAPPAAPWRLLRTRFVSVLTIAKVFLDPVWYFYIFWFPQYLSSVHHFDMAKIGMTAWIPFVTADLGNLVAGGFTGHLIKRGMDTSRARKTGAAVFILLMTAAIPAALVSNVWVAIACISTATFGYTGYNTNALAFPADVFPKNMVGSIWGLASMGAGFGGMIFGWLSGRMIDHYGYVPVFIGYGIMPLIALALILFALGPLRPLQEFKSHTVVAPR
ncbi:MAG TPA: MFS transporter [Opitutaceae bacterium]|nr:MFS transporter [Opitutaceae bacterium]